MNKAERREKKARRRECQERRKDDVFMRGAHWQFEYTKMMREVEQAKVLLAKIKDRRSKLRNTTD